jgi:hypothetical protein
VAVTSPVVLAIDSVVAIANGDFHAVALREDGSVWTWGTNEMGQLGNGSYDRHYVPTPIGLTDVVAVGAARRYSVALKSDGSLWYWGGALYHPDPALGPRQFPGLSCSRVYAVENYITCVDPEGKVWLTSVPYQVPWEAPYLKGLIDLAGGDDDFLPLVSGGGRWGLTWSSLDTLRRDLPPSTAIGYDTLLVQRAVPWSMVSGRLAWEGPRTVVSQAVPAVGVVRSGVIAADGRVWRWGVNTAGQVGDGSLDRRQTPVAVPGLRLFDDPWLLADTDGDGLRNVEEFDLGTDPGLADSNGDGLSDGLSVGLGRDPSSLDLDGDGLTNAEELALGTDPLAADTDGDGVSDALDAYPLDPDRWDTDPPDPGDISPPDVILTEPRNAVLISTTP